MAIRRSLTSQDVLAAAAAAEAAQGLPADRSRAAEVAPDPTAAAFFDVDNTLMQGASLFHFARGLAARKYFSSRDLARFALSQARFVLAGTENHEAMRHARETGLAFVKGADVAEITALSEEIYDEQMAAKVYSGTLALAQRHLAAGQRVWLVTATPVELATIIARRLGFTGALGTVPEVQDGRYTGRLVGDFLHGPAKAEALRALAEREGLDLRRCSAYSDSVNDLPMLLAVGYPTAVNPDPDLRRYAIAHDWPMRDFRTGRRAAKAGAGTAAVVGVGVVIGFAVRRAVEQRPPGR